MSIDDLQIQPLLEPINIYEISNDEPYLKNMVADKITIYSEHWPDVTTADVFIIGVNDMRGNLTVSNISPANEIRAQFYKLFYWHSEVKIIDLGNIVTGKTLQDTYAALASVIEELQALQKPILIVGGSNDMVQGQYQANVKLKQLVEITGVDALIDIEENQFSPATQYLYPILTSEPNYALHYNHLGFQSYFVNPDLLQTIDKLRFDCFRVGKLKEHIEEAEPLMRASKILYFDVNAIAGAYMPGNAISPNGFTGEEACILSRYAGMTTAAATFGIYGYHAEKDPLQLGALQIAQMMWYYIDGVHKRMIEAQLSDNNSFNEFHLNLAEVNTSFLQSKKTGRWWMQLPNGQYVPSSLKDYQVASRNEIPERWYRIQEREV
jgi:formiminoglutamase